MNKILIIGAGVGQVELIKAAKLRGLYTVVVSPKGNYPGIPFADKLIEEDIYNKDSIVEKVKAENVIGVISDQSDLIVPTVAYVSQKLGLQGSTTQVAEIYSNKQAQREFCKKNNIQIPKFTTINCLDSLNTIKIPFPWIIKPVDSQSSHGISMVYNLKEASVAFNDAIMNSKKQKVIVEEFFEGREIVCEGFVVDGIYYNLAFGDRSYFNIKGKFIPSKTIFPSDLNIIIKEKIIESEINFAKKANASFGIIHSEYLINEDNEFKLVETALRGGGVCISTHIIPTLTNLNLTELLLDFIQKGKQYVVNKLNINRFNSNKIVAYVCYYLPQGVVTNIEGIEYIEKCPYIFKADINQVVVGYSYNGIVNKSNRIGPFLFCCDTKEQLYEQIALLKSNYKVYLNDSNENSIIWE